MKKAAVLFGSLCFGAVMGTIAKYLDTVPWSELKVSHLLNYFADLFTRTGVWVFMAVLLAVFSKSFWMAAGKVFLFFAGMLTAYYIYSAALFGFFPTKYFIYWGILGLAGTAGAIVAWFAKHHDKCAWFLPALPMGLMISLSFAYGMFYIDITHKEEIMMLLVMMVIFFKDIKQMAVNLGLAAVVAVMIKVFLPFSLG